jgi:hypothetical protein
VLSAVVLAGGSFFWHPALLLLALQAVLYAAALLAGGIDLGVRTGDALAIPGSMLAFATMHLAWGVAFWWSLLTSWFGSHG